MDHPEIAGKVAETSQASYASPFFKIKKTKK
jgi:hypothetical protein